MRFRPLLSRKYIYLIYNTFSFSRARTYGLRLFESTPCQHRVSSADLAFMTDSPCTKYALSARWTSKPTRLTNRYRKVCIVSHGRIGRRACGRTQVAARTSGRFEGLSPRLPGNRDNAAGAFSAHCLIRNCILPTWHSLNILSDTRLVGKQPFDNGHIPACSLYFIVGSFSRSTSTQCEPTIDTR